MFADAEPLLILAIILIVGVLFGQIARRLHLPSVTGQILVGIAIGHSGLDLFGSSALSGLDSVTSFALGLIAVSVGSHLNVIKLRNAVKRLAILAVAEATITPVLVIVSVIFLVGERWEVAILLGALAVSTAPATIIAIVKETRSKGVFVKTLVAAVALNNVACICLFELARQIARTSLDQSVSMEPFSIVVASMLPVVLSAALGVGC